MSNSRRELRGPFCLYTPTLRFSYSYRMDTPLVPEPQEVRAFFSRRGCLVLLNRALPSDRPVYRAAVLCRPPSGEGLLRPVRVHGRDAWGEGLTWTQATRAVLAALAHGRLAGRRWIRPAALRSASGWGTFPSPRAAARAVFRAVLLHLSNPGMQVYARMALGLALTNHCGRPDPFPPSEQP